MKNKLLIIFLLFASICEAQFFQATMKSDGNDLVFYIRANPGGGDINTSWSDIEFLVRWPDGSPAFTFGSITVNSSDFPGISIPNNGADQQGAEVGYTNNWFGTSFTVTTSNTYTDGQEYEVFRVTLDTDPSSISFELVHNSFYSPHYLALTDGTGSDLTNHPNLVFYGESAMICSPNCPSSTSGNNHVVGDQTVLPVEWLSFNARSTNRRTVELSWQTANELNNDYFVVERSADGLDFVALQIVQGAGTSYRTETYQARDESPLTGHNYYRIKQVDFDGHFDYTHIERVTLQGNNITISNCIPNPAYNGETSIYINMPNAGKLQSRIYELSGHLVYTQDQYLAKGQNEFNLKLRNLNAGLYLVQLLIGEDRYIRKLVIERY